MPLAPGARPLALCFILIAPEALADVGEWEGNYKPEPATRRSDFMGLLQVGAALGSAAGYPNEAAKIDEPEFRADTGVGVGPGGGLFLGFAPRDWFTFAIGLSQTSLSAGDLESSGTTFLVHADVFPLFYEGGAFRDLGVFGEFGAGGRDIVRNGEAVAEGGFTSCVGGGVFFEPLKLGFLRTGPMLAYMHEFSTTLSMHQVLGGLRVAVYSGP